MKADARAEAPPRWPPIAAAICLGLAIALSLAAMRDDPFPGDLSIILAVQAPEAPILDSLAWALTRLGRFLPMAAIGGVVAALVWRRGASNDAAVVVAATLLYPLNWFLKALIDRERPADGAAGVFERASGLGFPSGHAFGAMLLFGTMAILAASRIGPRMRRATVVAGCLGLALAIGWSRVRLGAHWPSDVLGGWLWGAGFALLLLVFDAFERVNVGAALGPRALTESQ
ncbi:MAG: phosphatase PAP2 family protein [Chloroflexia bacterium]|nr:phosphatase PAP2 family protein [Chloroflexia bacterium]